jgi:hypothetical protein
MKKLLMISMVIASLTACNDASTDNSTVTTSDSTTTMSAPAPIDTTPATTPTTTTTTVYSPAEGDVTYRNRKLMVWKGNDWTEAEGDVTLDNGVVVNRKGEVKRNNDVVVLDDGEVVNRSGNFFDKAGNAIEDGWDATKKGVKKAGSAIGKAAGKTKDAIVGDDDKKK